MTAAMVDIGNPLVQSAVVVAVGIVVLALRRWRSGVALIAVALAWAWLCATPAFSLMLWKSLANQYPPQPIADYPHADAIVLVGGALSPEPLDKWTAIDDPALSTPPGVAVALYNSGKAPLIVATSNYATPVAAQALIRQGIPASAIRLEPESKTTRQDAIDSRRALRQANVHSILLVTTASHMPRTVATYRKLGFAVVPAATHPPAWLDHARRSLKPKAALQLSKRFLHEYLGLAYYRLRGWAAW